LNVLSNQEYFILPTVRRLFCRNLAKPQSVTSYFQKIITLKNPFKILIIINTLTRLLLYGDLFTSSFSIPEIFHGFSEAKYKYSRTKSGNQLFEINKFLYAQSGNRYHIGIIPKLSPEIGQPIEIQITTFLGKVKSISFKSNGKDNITLSLSFLLDYYVIAILILTVVITIASAFYNHALLDYGLMIFSGVTCAIAAAYIFYF